MRAMYPAEARVELAFQHGMIDSGAGLVQARNDRRQASAFPQQVLPGLLQSFTLGKEGAGNAGCTDRTRSLVCRKKHTS